MIKLMYASRFGTMLASSSVKHFSLSWQVLRYHTPDYYVVLGVGKHANIKEIKLAYFNMAKQFHPDANQTLDAPQMFQLIAEAYDVLSDPDRRKEYDETGVASEKFGGTSSGPGRQKTDSPYTADQMYTKIFGSESAQAAQSEFVHEDFAETYSGSSVSSEHIVNVSFEEAALGVAVYLYLRVSAVCNKCGGSKSELGYQGNICPYCEGTGQETIKTGHITARKTCSYCYGTRIFIKFKCIECHGIGRHIVERPYRVEIAPGTLNGQVMRLELEEKELKLPPDEMERLRQVWVTVAVGESEEFTRVGDDLHGNLELSPALAMLGGVATARGLGKLIGVQVPPGTSSHRSLVEAGKGIRCSDHNAGDFVLRTCIKVPKKLSRKQRNILVAFAALDSPESGVVEGVDTPDSHKYLVNIKDPDKVKNERVNTKVKPETMSWSDQIRQKLGMTISQNAKLF